MVILVGLNLINIENWTNSDTNEVYGRLRFPNNTVDGFRITPTPPNTGFNTTNQEQYYVYQGSSPDSIDHVYVCRAVPAQTVGQVTFPALPAGQIDDGDSFRNDNVLFVNTLTLGGEAYNLAFNQNANFYMYGGAGVSKTVELDATLSIRRVSKYENENLWFVSTDGWDYTTGQVDHVSDSETIRSDGVFSKRTGTDDHVLIGPDEGIIALLSVTNEDSDIVNGIAADANIPAFNAFPV